MSDDAIARLQAAALKAREFTHEVGERTYTLRVPTRTERFQVLHRHGLSTVTGATLWLQMTYLLQEAIVGWTGVRERDVVPGAGSDPLPWSAPAVALLLDALDDDRDQLGLELDKRIGAREGRLEEDAKNSRPESSGPASPTSADSTATG